MKKFTFITCPITFCPQTPFTADGWPQRSVVGRLWQNSHPQRSLIRNRYPLSAICRNSLGRNASFKASGTSTPLSFGNIISSKTTSGVVSAKISFGHYAAKWAPVPTACARDSLLPSVGLNVNHFAARVGKHFRRVARGRPCVRRLILLTGIYVCESMGWTSTHVSFSRGL